MKNNGNVSKSVIIIESKRWNGILDQLNKGIKISINSGSLYRFLVIRTILFLSDKKDTILNERETNFKEYLKTGSKKMLNQWENSKDALRNKANEEKIQKEQERLADLDQKYKVLMETDELLRHEKLAKSQDLASKLKHGPKQLESAAVYAEVLKGREIQRKINSEKRQNEKLKHLEQGKEAVMQAEQWIAQHDKRSNEKYQRDNTYKRELFQYIKSEDEKRQEMLNKENEAERLKREASDREIKDQLDRERIILERKKDALRKNALEAMIMAEQRRKRHMLTDIAQDKLNDAYSIGKQNLEKIQNTLINERRIKSIQMKQSIAEQIYQDNTESKTFEEERLKKEENEITEKLKQREREKIANDKKLKAARIEAHIRDIEHQKQLKAAKMQDLQYNMASLKKNIEVSHDYEQQKKQHKLKMLTENRSILLQQIDERIKRDKAEKAIDEFEFAKSENILEDQYFFKYADELIADAKIKGRSLLPLQRTVEMYKAANRLNPPNDYLPHLKSNVPIMKDCKHCAPFKYDIDELKSLNSKSPKPL